MFGGGESPLLNAIARLSVLYEDFRVEYALLGEIAALTDDEALSQKYRFLYLIRRSVATMDEFRGGLIQLLKTDEFQAAAPFLSKMDKDCIDDANQYLQRTCDRIKEWRNEIGGHFQHSAGAVACRNLTPGTMGSVTWDSEGGQSPLALRLQYAEYLVAGVIAGLLPGTDPLKELKEAMEEIMGGYSQMQKASYALVHHFLWSKFG